MTVKLAIVGVGVEVAISVEALAPFWVSIVARPLNTTAAA
jgi:hypothetical protein